MKLEAGTLIAGRYALHGPLDRGAMGAVWVARDARTRERVALKFLEQPLLNEETARRFRREAKALEHLDHPNVVKMLDHGLEGNAPYIAMELLDGETLRSLTKRRRTLPPLEVVALLRQAAAGLSAAHALGIVHRDIKPSNLFVCDTDGTQVKIIDFGIATGDPLETSTRVTHGLIGSPAYMSPEQARGQRVDHLADVWSLTAVAFELLTGREPFPGANVPETLKRICSGISPKATAVASGLPPDTDALFERAFAAAAEERFQSATKFVEELARVCAAAPNRAATALSSPPSSGRSTATVTRAVEASVRYIDEVHCLAWYENVQLILSLAQPSYEFMLMTMVEMAAQKKHAGRAGGIFVVIKSDADPPDERARDYMKHVFLQSELIVAAAQVVEGTGFRGAAVRSVLTMMNLAVGSSFPISVFGNVGNGAAWLSRQLVARAGYGPDPVSLARVANELRSHFKAFSDG